MWIDTHCHIFNPAFDADRQLVIKAAREVGISKMIVVGYDLLSNRQALQLADQNEDMWAVLGVHPCDCESLTDKELTWILEQAQFHKKVVAIGEIGLDYHHMKFPKEVQEMVFRKQIRLAKELNLPCIIHSRDAAEDTLKILIDESADRVVFHCYSYDYEFAKKLWERAYYTSFSGILTYPKADALREVAKKAPDNLILIESDCPYLAPQKMRGKRNEMAFVSEIAHILADLREVSIVNLAQKLYENTSRCFRI